MGVKGKVRSGVLDQVTQTSGAVDPVLTGSLGNEAELGSIFEVTARNPRDTWRWRSGAKRVEK